MIDEIKNLLDKGYKTKDIAKNLNMSISMIKKYKALINLYSSTENKLSKKSQKTLYDLELKAIVLLSIKDRYTDLDCILSNIGPDITRRELMIIVDAVKETRSNIDKNFILNIHYSKNNKNKKLINLATKYFYFKNYSCCSSYKLNDFEIDVIGYNIENDKVVIIETLRKNQEINSLSELTKYCDELYILTDIPDLMIKEDVGILYIDKLNSSKNIRLIKKSSSFNRTLDIKKLLFDISYINSKKFLFKY